MAWNEEGRQKRAAYLRLSREGKLEYQKANARLKAGNLCNVCKLFPRKGNSNCCHNCFNEKYNRGAVKRRHFDNYKDVKWTARALKETLGMCAKCECTLSKPITKCKRRGKVWRRPRFICKNCYDALSVECQHARRKVRYMMAGIIIAFKMRHGLPVNVWKDGKWTAETPNTPQG